jgi:hypothetical protein
MYGSEVERLADRAARRGDGAASDWEVDPREAFTGLAERPGTVRALLVTVRG